MTRPFYPQIVEKLVYRRLDFTSRQCVEQQRETFAIRFNQREREGIRSSFPSFPRPEEKHATISGGGWNAPFVHAVRLFTKHKMEEGEEKLSYIRGTRIGYRSGCNEGEQNEERENFDFSSSSSFFP